MVVVDVFTVTFMQKILRLVVTLGNYTLTIDSYVVDLEDTNIVLGVDWLHSLGEITMNYQVMEMKFNTANNNKVVLRGMSNGGPKIVLTKSMEKIFRHGDVACVACWLWSLIIFLIQRSLLSVVFIPHEDFTPQKYVHSSTRGSAGWVTPSAGSRGAIPPTGGFGGEAPEGKFSL
jgi:hypothetical protein